MAVDLEEQAYTVHERVYGGTPLTGRPTFGSLDFERSYTEPVTKYKTVENELKIIPGKIKTNPIKINV